MDEAVPFDLYKYSAANDTQTVIKINGAQGFFATEKGYAVLIKKWKKGDVVEVYLPMEVQQVVANEKVKDDVGKIAL